ncbi:MAG: monovalent cation/H+ antiporter subunit D family protein [Chromatiales bacterium]|nr:monovalent cation/H+ antiporter subunit D family protein [Chromatiales bacterium]
MTAGALLLCLATPFVAALLILLNHKRPTLINTVNTVAPFISLLALIWLASLYNPAADFKVTLLDIVGNIGITFSVEPLGLIFAGLVCVLWPVSSLYAMTYMYQNNLPRTTHFFACYSLAIGSALGIAFADNLLTLFIFYEILSFSTYPLVVHSRTSEALKAGWLYLLTLVGASALFLLTAIIWIGYVAGSLDFEKGGILPGYTSAMETTILLLLVVFGTTKAAIMPLHRWLPSAMVAPVPVSALLHAVAVVKAGVFTIMKIVVYTFGVDTLTGINTDWLVYLAGFTILAASVIALKQVQLKKLLAYSTISQLSYIILGVAILHPLALSGAALYIVAHGFAKITLFFAAGAIYTVKGFSRIRELDGIGHTMPWTMGLFTISSLSIIGMPPLIGFTSKWFLLEGAVASGSYVAIVVLVTGSVLSAAYLLPIIHRAFFRPRLSLDNDEAPLVMRIAMLVPTLTCVLLFFYSDQIIALIGGLL